MDDNLKITSKKKLRKVTAPIVLQPDYTDLIREAAYKLFEERNYEHGYATIDWLTAEARIHRLMLV